MFTIPSPIRKTRLEWLDALRGFTMLLVVANHVYGSSLDANTARSMFMSLCLMFRMPLFFFVSGFLAYKASMAWSGSETLALMWKKVKVQLIPTLVFMTAYVALVSNHFWEQLVHAWSSPTKSGFWFTLVLLEMFLVYYAVCFVIRRIVWLRDREDDPFELVALLTVWAISFFGYTTMYMPAWFTWPKDEIWQWTSLTEFVRYFHFFLFGNLCHRYWDRFQQLLDTSWFYPLLVLIAFFCAGDYLVWHSLRLQWANLPRTLAMYTLVVMVVAFFRHYSDSFRRETRVGATLQYIGIRTLDVYLLHYFFLPHLRFLGPMFKARPTSFAIDAALSLGLTALVVGLALLTSNILRVSPFLKKWLFGRT